MHDVVYRCRWKTSAEVTTTQGCVRGDGRGNVSMRRLYLPSKNSIIHSQHTGRSWREWKFSSTWGGFISSDDANNQAMRSNLRKACGCWAQVSRVLWAENASPWTFMMFYKATVQAVLLYGSKAWSLFPSSLKHLEGFHICATWGMLGKRPERNEDGSSLGGSIFCALTRSDAIRVIRPDR